jgi:magnesium-transporting ATPase (P-type)
MEFVVNNWWPVDINRLDLVRAAAQDRTDAASLLEAANFEIILVFLATVLTAVTGLVLPISYLLNRRFAAYTDHRFGEMEVSRLLVALRQSMAAGIWVAFCLWLQMNRSFGLAVALLVATVLILFEVLLQIRSRASQANL